MKFKRRLALAAVNGIGNKADRLTALAAIVRLPSDIQIDTFWNLLDTVGRVSWPRAIAAVEAGLLPTFKSGGQAAVLEIHRAINDVYRWYLQINL